MTKKNFLMRALIVAGLCCLFAADGLQVARPAYADKVFIDITSPSTRKLPVAVQPFIGNSEVSSIVKSDLMLSGLFECLPDAAQIEQTSQPFNVNNWRGLGVELVVKGRVTSGLNMIITAHDVADGREVLRKEYSASSQNLIRPLAHSIANDIYRVLTGQQGIFRTKLAFVGEAGGRREIYTSDWDGQRMNASGISGGVLLKPRWSPDGAKLLYSAERMRQWDLFVLDIAAMRERHIPTMHGLKIAGTFFPDNRQFVFASSRGGDSDIFVSDSAGSHVRKIISSPWIDTSPAASPDGKSILFVSNRSGGPQIFLAGSDGSNIRRVTYQGNYNTSPAWAPAGDRLVYSSMVGGRHQIFVMKLDGSEVRQLTDRGNNEEPAFSPDGRFIVFMSDRDGMKGIYLMLANGENQTRITPRGLKAYSPSWGPN